MAALHSKVGANVGAIAFEPGVKWKAAPVAAPPAEPPTALSRRRSDETSKTLVKREYYDDAPDGDAMHYLWRPSAPSLMPSQMCASAPLPATKVHRHGSSDASAVASQSPSLSPATPLTSPDLYCRRRRYTGSRASGRRTRASYSCAKTPGRSVRRGSAARAWPGRPPRPSRPPARRRRRRRSRRRSRTRRPRLPRPRCSDYELRHVRPSPQASHRRPALLPAASTGCPEPSPIPRLPPIFPSRQRSVDVRSSRALAEVGGKGG